MIGLLSAAGGWESPDPERVFAQQQFPVFSGVEIQVAVHEFQFFVHRQLPAWARISSAPDQLLAAELLVDRFEEWKSVFVWIVFRQRQLVRLRRADPDLRE